MRVDLSLLSEVLGARVAAVEEQPVGTGQVGTSVRLTITYADGDDGPRSLVGKFTADDPSSRAAGIALGNYEREVRFYDELAPELPVRAPRCYHASWDPAAQEMVLLLEDLAPATVGDQIEGCDVATADAALAAIATAHAARWADPGLEAFGWLNGWGGPAAGLVQAAYEGLWPGFAERFGDALGPELLAVSERAGARLAGWLESYAGPRSLTHGDYRLDNLLFRDGEVAVVDWQSPGRGPALVDVAYFLATSLGVDDRRAAERELVGAYHDRLAAAGVDGYGWEDCWFDYRRMLFSPLVTTVVASMIVRADARGDAMFSAMATRALQAIVDLDAEATLPAA